MPSRRRADRHSAGREASARTSIDPKVDVVFIRLFTDPEHKGVCIGFLNAVLPLSSPVVDIEVQTPFVMSQWLRHKRPVVDVLARDRSGAIFQIELQRQRESALATRMLYSLCRLVGAQLKQGEDYSRLRPVWSIWLLEEPLGPEWPEGRTLFQLRSKPRSPESSASLSELANLVLLQLHRPLRPRRRRWSPGFCFSVAHRPGPRCPKRPEFPQSRRHGRCCNSSAPVRRPVGSVRSDWTPSGWSWADSAR
jgi:PD-(D/E)XK nuclease family transposase